MSDEEHFQSICDEVYSEQSHAREKWGNRVDREVNRPTDWMAYITHHNSRWMAGQFAPYTRDNLHSFRKEMIKVANLAITAAQETDLILNGDNPRPDVLKDE